MNKKTKLIILAVVGIIIVGMYFVKNIYIAGRQENITSDQKIVLQENTNRDTSKGELGKIEQSNEIEEQLPTMVELASAT